MLRRSHRKSRAGCPECKGRHMKCDERHPICVNCSTAKMRCSFASARPMKGARVKEVALAPSSDVASRSSTPSTGLTQSYVNTTHMELLYSLLEDGEWVYGQSRLNAASPVSPQLLKYAFAYPFLLHELLAVSALRLSVLRRTQKCMYRAEATRLQSEAMRLFNETIQDLSCQNIIPAFFFSGLLGIATFFETFHDRAGGENGFVFFDKIMQSMRLLQSVRAIVAADGWWDFLLQSEVKDMLLLWEEEPNKEWSDEVVVQFETFRAQMLKSPGLDQARLLVCDQAIERLIWMYRSAFSNAEERPIDDQAAGKYAIRWLIHIRPAFTDLLVEGKPEALVIWGHFSIILHKLRASWIIGDAGRQLLSVVESRLEEEWHEQLSWPKSLLEGD